MDFIIRSGALIWGGRRASPTLPLLAHLRHHAKPCKPYLGTLMAVIDIRREHAKSVKSAKASVERVATAIAKDFGIDHHWTGDTLKFDRSGVKGHIAVEKHEIHVRVELGFLMSALKPMIQTEIEAKLDENLA